jgi:hypothetical protein
VPFPTTEWVERLELKNMRYTKPEFQRWADEKYDEVVIKPWLKSYKELPFWPKVKNRMGKYWMKFRLRVGLFDLELWKITKLERLRRYKSGDKTYKNF